MQDRDQTDPCVLGALDRLGTMVEKLGRETDRFHDVQLEGLVKRIRDMTVKTTPTDKKKTPGDWLKNDTIYRMDPLGRKIMLQEWVYIDDSMAMPWEQPTRGNMVGYCNAIEEEDRLIQPLGEKMDAFQAEFDRAADTLRKHHAFPHDFDFTETQISEALVKAELEEVMGRKKLLSEELRKIIAMMEADEAAFLKRQAEGRRLLLNP